MSKSTAARTINFHEMARLVNDRVDDPAASGVERYVGLEHLDADSLRIRRWGEITDVESTKLRFRPGDIIFGKRRVYQRKLAVADFEGICSAHAMVLRARPEGVVPEFLPFFMQSDRFMTRALEISVGSLSPTINWSTLANQQFALPAIEQQLRLVNALSSADRAIESLRKLSEANQLLLTSVAAHEIGQRSWPERQLGSLLDYASDGPFGSKIKTEHYVQSGARVIRLNNIDENRFNDEDKAFVSKGYFLSALKSYEVKAGDVIVAGLGDERIPAGRACVVPDSVGLAINKADCFCLRPTEQLVARYLAFFLNSPRGLAQSKAFSQGTTRLRLNLGNIRNMLVPVPPVAVQKEIVMRMDSLLDASEALAARARVAGDFRKQLLQTVYD